MIRHLAVRFFTSLRPGGPRAEDEAWAVGHLTPAEIELWALMSNPDQRHALRVARRVEEAFGDDPPSGVMAAALLHDIGKTDAKLRTYGRVVATLTIALAGKKTVVTWTSMRGIWRKIGLYAEYPRLGSEMLQLAGSDPLAVAWAREHHEPADEWTVPRDVGEILAAADE